MASTRSCLLATTPTVVRDRRSASRRARRCRSMTTAAFTARSSSCASTTTRAAWRSSKASATPSRSARTSAPTTCGTPPTSVAATPATAGWGGCATSRSRTSRTRISWCTSAPTSRTRCTPRAIRRRASSIRVPIAGRAASPRPRPTRRPAAWSPSARTRSRRSARASRASTSCGACSPTGNPRRSRCVAPSRPTARRSSIRATMRSRSRWRTSRRS